MCNQNSNTQKRVADMLLDAHKASALIRSLQYSWAELQVNEVDTLLEISSKYADSVLGSLGDLISGELECGNGQESGHE